MSDREQESRDTVICAKCNKPTRSARSGTITQWISGCDCDLVEASDVNAPPIEICSECGKRVGTGRAGSLTQWIFRADVCSCESTAKKPTIAQKVLAERAASQTQQSVDEDEAICDLAPGEFIAGKRYKPLKRLGSGASGSVFLCRDLVLHRKVAVKKLRKTSADTIIDFQNEAQTCSRLKHANIVSILDLSSDESGVPYMVMEYVDGITLENHLKNSGPLSLENAVCVLLEICDALSYAHQLGILHRDVKSSNILLSKEHAFLIDFGIAKFKGLLTDGELLLDTASSTIAGSPYYMPPDQGLGLKYDERSEVYSTGCVLYEALTGKTPFEGASGLGVLALHAQEIPPPLAHAYPEGDFSEDIEALVAKCLEKKPDDRFQSMQELKAALNDLEIPDRSTESAEQTDSRSYQALFPAPMQTKHPLVTAAIVAALAATVGGMTIRLFSKDKRVDAPPPVAKNTQPIRKAEDFNEQDRREIIEDAIKRKEKKLQLSSGFIKDSDLDALKDYKLATNIDLTGNPVTDQGLMKITGPYLKFLVLTNSDVRTLEFLPKFRNLQSLQLQGTNVTDQSLRNLKAVPMLKELRLNDGPISDAGLRLIAKNAQSLEFLTLNNTRVTAQGIKDLQVKLPMTFITPGAAPPALRRFESINRFEANHDNEAALKAANEAVAIVEKGQGKNGPALVAILLRRSNTKLLAKKKGAEEDLFRALKIARDSGNDNLLKAALAAVRSYYTWHNETDKVAAVTNELRSVVRRLDGEDSPELVADLFDQAEMYADLEPAKAEKLYKQFLRSEYASDKDPRYAWALAGLGRVNRNQKNYVAAEVHYKQALNVLAKMQITKPRQIARIIDLYYELSLCAQALGKWDDAIAYETKGLEISSARNLSERVKIHNTRIAGLKLLAASANKK
jgi:serine/threonine protein kinase